MQHDEHGGRASPGAGIETHEDRVAPFVILGRTAGGRTFRPSDWAERLAGVMSAFRPGKAGTQHHLRYSPYVVPSSQDGVKCVIVDPALRKLEPMAYSFVLNFARDNDLVLESLDRPGPPAIESNS